MRSENHKSPLEIYLECCEQIALAFESDGYRYSSSGRRLSKSQGPFRFEISFQSSKRNAAGEFVGIWIQGNVHSPRLKKWRQSNASLRGPSDIVGEGLIGILASNPELGLWNVADPVHRDVEISNMIRTIRSVILPYFSTFEDIPTACDLMARLNIPGIYVIDLLDFLMCFSDQLSTRVAAVNYLDRRPKLKPFYAQMFERFARNGIPEHQLYPPPEALAAASIVYQFGDLLDG